MSDANTYDALVVGGGPAGSTAARWLSRGGLRVAVVDRARFPRDKLCAGWVSPALWETLELRPEDYPRGLWPWQRCHIYFCGERYTVDGQGWFIRRYELDDYLLRLSGADLIEGHSARAIEWQDEHWCVDGRFRARYLVGAGGAHCPVARCLFPKKPEPPVGVQELELKVGAADIAKSRVGGDGEPELLLHDDLRGYGWNVPKSDWLNVGCGTAVAREVTDAWRRDLAFFADQGHLPSGSGDVLRRARGYAYHLFDPRHLEACGREGALLVGDALGLAQPLTAEGILPAVLSGRRAAEAILAGDPDSYGQRLRDDPIIADYERVFHLRETLGRFGARSSEAGSGPRAIPRPARAAVARGFAWMFSGKPLPAGKAIDLFVPKANPASHGSERAICEFFASAGVTVNGPASWDIRVSDRRFFARALSEGSLGLGESYMEGWWECDDLVEFTARIVRGRCEERVKKSHRLALDVVKARLLNMQAPSRAYDVGEQHYDLGNDLYTAMLDSRLQYTCGYWRHADNLEAAQESKLDLICRKVGITPGMRVLELGCGWGGFAKFAAERYGATVTGYTVSKEQVELGRERCQGLPVTLLLEDYRRARGNYDAVVSIGLMEHVGPKNYAAYMEVVERCLAADGIAFVHTIGGITSRLQVDPWYERYIFPHAVLPSLTQLSQALEGRFVIEDVHNIGPDYERTLLAWEERFEDAWPSLRDKYGDRFYRMWKYYLGTAAGGFRARHLQLYQLVFTRFGTPQPDCRRC